MYKIIGANQQEYGPVSGDQLRQWITEGRADANTMALPEGGTEWKALRDLPEFAGLFAVQPAPGPVGVQPVIAPPSYTPVPAAPATVPNYLVQAILCTLCCCIPTGIAAIVYASQVNSKVQIGDYAGAQEASKKAKMWCWISLALGLVGGVVWGIIQALAVGLQGVQNH